jgi:hypothetical protein
MRDRANASGSNHLSSYRHRRQLVSFEAAGILLSIATAGLAAAARRDSITYEKALKDLLAWYSAVAEQSDRSAIS